MLRINGYDIPVQDKKEMEELKEIEKRVLNMGVPSGILGIRKSSLDKLKEINKDRVTIDKSNSYNFEGVTGEKLNVIGKLIGKGVNIDG